MAEVDAGAVAPAETVVTPASTDAPAPESPAEQATEAPQGGEQPSKPARTYTEEELQKTLQKRLGIESRRLERVARAEARAEFAEGRLREQQQPQQRPAQAGEPKSTDFKDWDSYNAALIEYRVDQRVNETLSKREQESQAQQDRREASERASSVQSKLSNAKEKYEDFDDVALAPNVPISEPMAAFIAESDLGGDIAYHLGSHLDEADKIARLTPAAAFRELVKLESKLSAAPAPTKVPAPIVPNASRATVEKRLEDAQSQEEFNAIRRRQIAARRR